MREMDATDEAHGSGRLRALACWAGGRRTDRAVPQVRAPWPMLAALVAVCALDLRDEVGGKGVPALAAVHHAS